MVGQIREARGDGVRVGGNLTRKQARWRGREGKERARARARKEDTLSLSLSFSLSEVPTCRG